MPTLQEMIAAVHGGSGGAPQYTYDPATMGFPSGDLSGSVPAGAGTSPLEAALAQPTNSPDSWETIMGQYGLGPAPAEGLPSVLQGVQAPSPALVSTDPSQFMGQMDQFGGRIGEAFNYDPAMMQAALMDPSQVPQLTHMGIDPADAQRMRASAIEGPAQGGLQQMSLMKRALGQAGISGGAGAAAQGQIARETGYEQGRGLRDVETNIGLTNMQQANQMALANANRLFAAMQGNQQMQQQANMQNQQGQQAQQQNKSNMLGSFYGNQAQQWGSQAHDANMFNATQQNINQRDQTAMDWQKQLLPWQEMNQRFGQANQILGSWGQQ